MLDKSEMIFGVRAVIEAIQAGKEIDKILVKKDIQSDLSKELFAALKGLMIPVQRVPVERINRITRKNHQGVIAFISSVTYQKTEDLVPFLFEQGKNPFFVMLDGVTDVRNFGAIARTCECAAVDAVIIPARGSASVNADAVKTSAGALHTLPVCREQNLRSTLQYLKDSGFRIVAATEKGDYDYTKADYTGPLCIIMGAEDTGVSYENLALCDEWISSYAGMFLTLAQEKGYAVHANVLNKWKRFQRAAAQNWRMPQEASGWQQWQSELQQAFRLYTLALAGVPEYGAMNRMKEQTGLSIQAKWRLAAAYALTGKMKPAEELVYNVETTVNPYSSMNQIYGSSDRDEAMILETLILMNRERDALQQAKVVSKNLSQEDWFSTQSTAFALMAMGRLAEKLSGTLDFVWSWNDKQQPAVKSAKAVFEKEIATTPKSGTVSVKNQGKGALSVDLITRTQLLNDTLPAISDNLRMDIRYANLNGTPLSVNDIIQGTDFMAITSISNISGTSDYTNLALTHIIPSGWEIYNERMVAPETENAAADGSGQSVSKYSYQDIRDDRVLTYFNLRRGETKVFTVRLQATYAGNFILPAVQCEAMYDVNVQARSKAGRTTVSR